jgi:hypothetical protein
VLRTRPALARQAGARKNMHIAIGCFARESHRLSPVPGSWLHFGPQEVQRGQSMFEGLAGTRAELNGALTEAVDRQLGILDVSVFSVQPWLDVPRWAAAWWSSATVRRGRLRTWPTSSGGGWR